MQKYHILIVCLVVANASITKDELRWQICKRQSVLSKDSYELELLYDYANLTELDLWIYMIGCPIALIQGITLTLLFIFNSKLRQSPGDIYLGNLLFEMLLAVHWFYSALYQYLNGSIMNSSFTCQFNAGLSLFGASGSFLYAIAFFYYLRDQLNNSFSSNQGKTWRLHLIIILTSLTIITLLFIFNLTGKTVDGLCSIQIVKLDEYMIFFFYCVFIIIYLTIGIYSITFIRNNIPTSQRLNKASKDFIRFSIFYFITYFFMTVISETFEIVADVNCDYLIDQKLEILFIFQHSINVLTIIVLPIIRSQDPYTKRILMKIFTTNDDSQQTFIHFDTNIHSSSEYSQRDSSIQENPFASNESSFVQNQESDIPKTKLIDVDEIQDDKPNKEVEIELQTKESQEQNQQEGDQRKSQLNTFQLQKSQTMKPQLEDLNSNFVSFIQTNLRLQIMYKMICGILIDDKAKSQHVLVQTQNIKQERDIFQEKKVYYLDDNVYVTELPDHPETSFLEADTEQVSKQVKMTTYVPIVFNAILKREREQINLTESLNLFTNLDRIKAAGKNDGGKSGQFFFFSSDNRLMLKTITATELKILIQKLHKYFMYMQTNKDTLIAKIYGIYTFEVSNLNKNLLIQGFIEKPIHLILMKNLARCNQVCIERIYDMKGSSYDREVIKKNVKINLQKVVLKDLDFKKLEEKLHVSREDAQHIMENAFADSLFFRDSGLIDYSMIIFKVNWMIMREKNPQMAEQLERNSQHIYQSTVDQDIKYHIGIIDYLQLYDVQKKMEKYSKKVLKLNKNLDTSSQDPTTYANRFSNFIRSIVENKD